MNNLQDIISELNNLNINCNNLDDLINLFNNIDLNDNKEYLINLFNLLNSKLKCTEYNSIKFNNNLIF